MFYYYFVYRRAIAHYQVYYFLLFLLDYNVVCVCVCMMWCDVCECGAMCVQCSVSN